MHSSALHYSFNRRKYLLALFINLHLVIEADLYKQQVTRLRFERVGP